MILDTSIRFKQSSHSLQAIAIGGAHCIIEQSYIGIFDFLFRAVRKWVTNFFIYILIYEYIKLSQVNDYSSTLLSITTSALISVVWMLECSNFFMQKSENYLHNYTNRHKLL